MRIGFDAELVLLNNELIEMGALCEKAIAAAINSLFSSNENSGTYGDSASIAKDALDTEDSINSAEKNIEAHCMRLLLKQQPVAKDLRMISSALKMICDMERIGDQAFDISDMSQYLRGKNFNSLKGIHEMAEATIDMVNSAVDSYVKKDLELAAEVIEHDDIVDEYFDSIRKAIIEIFNTKTSDGEIYLDLMLVTKYLERIGDHAGNIAEWVCYSLTGSHEYSTEVKLRSPRVKVKRIVS
jgi:phosphate transport system protein